MKIAVNISSTVVLYTVLWQVLTVKPKGSKDVRLFPFPFPSDRPFFEVRKIYNLNSSRSRPGKEIRAPKIGFGGSKHERRERKVWFSETGNGTRSQIRIRARPIFWDMLTSTGKSGRKFWIIDGRRPCETRPFPPPFRFGGLEAKKGPTTRNILTTETLFVIRAHFHRCILQTKQKTEAQRLACLGKWLSLWPT